MARVPEHTCLGCKNLQMESSHDANAAPLGQRRVPWIYLLPVVGAPVAHILVSASKTFPRHKKVLLWAVVASTVTAVGNRLWLMGDAGFPGAEGGKPRDRFAEEGSNNTPAADGKDSVV